ncbi:MAG TPA: zinc-binding dehydrogenase [Candidatus Micrarchaeia archaeon]|nr:zinc-binding dehydrogenase [Candidatus Micrarchaeia archaeon]
MLAVVFRDGAVAVVDRPDPVPEGQELLVRMAAAGLNGADSLQRQGRYPPPPGADPDVPGLEIAGTVAAVGPGVTRFGPGARVMGLLAAGGQAELALLHERVAMPIPDPVGWAAAGGFPETFTTAHDALVTQARLRPGERLLVHGAAGGVGTAAVQIAGLVGARVTATVRREASRPAVAGLGAAVLAPDDDWAAAGPFDVVLELVGGPNLEGDLRALAGGGRIVVIGIGAGASATVNLGQLMSRRAVLRGSTLRARALEEKALAARRVEVELLPALAGGRLRVPVEEEVPLAEAARAYRRFEAGGKVGKLVLRSGRGG